MLGWRAQANRGTHTDRTVAGSNVPRSLCPGMRTVGRLPLDCLCYCRACGRGSSISGSSVGLRAVGLHAAV